MKSATVSAAIESEPAGVEGCVVDGSSDGVGDDGVREPGEPATQPARAVRAAPVVASTRRREGRWRDTVGAIGVVGKCLVLGETVV